MMTKEKIYRKYNVLKITGALFVAIVVLWCTFSIKVNAAERAENDMVEYQLSETQFKSKIKNCLEEQGYYNSGITMTKVMDTDGSRVYTVLVHHQYLDTENMNEVNAVYESLWAIDMPDDNITVNYTIF